MKNLFFIRHGIAEDPDVAAKQGRGEPLRELTPDGIIKMKEAARGIARCVDQIDLIITSPLVRAVQTAEIVHAHFPQAKFESDNVLEPGMRFQDLSKFLTQYDEAAIALCGHEPDFSLAISEAVGSPGIAIEVKKGSLICLRCRDMIGPGLAELIFALAPKQLRQLGS